MSNEYLDRRGEYLEFLDAFNGWWIIEGGSKESATRPPSPLLPSVFEESLHEYWKSRNEARNTLFQSVEILTRDFCCYNPFETEVDGESCIYGWTKLLCKCWKSPKNWKKLAFPRILRDSAGTMDVYDWSLPQWQPWVWFFYHYKVGMQNWGKAQVHWCRSIGLFASQFANQPSLHCRLLWQIWYVQLNCEIFNYMKWSLKVGWPKCESSRNVIDQPAIKTYPFPLTLAQPWFSKPEKDFQQ